ARRSWRAIVVRGFNLVEVTLAVAIIGVSLALILGLFPLGLQASRDSQDYAMASTLAMDILNTFRASAATSFNSATLARFGTIGGWAAGHSCTFYYMPTVP